MSNFLLILTWCVVFADLQPSTQLTLAGKERFIATPRPGVRTVATTFYTRPTGGAMMSYHSEQTQSDKVDIAYQRFSDDHGRTWSEPIRLETATKVPSGTRRQSHYPGFVDLETGILLTMIMDGVLPNDKPLEGMQHWTLHYALSSDGGRTYYHTAPVVQHDGGHTSTHPLPGVWVGKNAAMIGDTTCVPIRIRTGEILQPVQITPIGPDGTYYNPGDGYTYHDAAVLIGRWNSERTLDWQLSDLVRGDPSRSTRGALEPTVAELPDGRILREDRISHQIVVHVSPLNRGPVATLLPEPHTRQGAFDWTADAWVYRIDVTNP